jgi:NADPH:quinone reductase-like Zn-dependent oxidoreductase
MLTNKLSDGSTGTTRTAGPVPSTMRAVMQRAYGSTDALHYTVTSTPAPRDNEVLIAVSAAAVDRATWHLMTGQPYAARLAFGLRKPSTPIPGRSLAGTVVEVGQQVQRFAVGDRVFGVGRGAFAQYATAAEDQLSEIPSGIEFAAAAAVPDSGLTALQAVVDVAQVAPGDSVLIIGASGGVGTFATQIASNIGADVTGVCSTAKTDLVGSLGANRVIDYTRATIESEGTDYDVVIDIGGNTSLRRLRNVMQPRGTLVIVGGEGAGKWLGGTDRQLRAIVWSRFVEQRLTTFIATEHHEGLDTLAAMLADGSVVAAVTQRCALADVAQTIDDLAAGRIAGKAVTVIDAAGDAS